MTLMRKAAVKILDAVVRLAPEASRDWAKAAQVEMGFIENDWAALRWALGSWKMAVRRQYAPLTSISEVPRAAQKFLRGTRVLMVVNRCALLCLAASFSLALAVSMARQGRPPSLLAGWGCVVIATVTYLVCDIVRWGWRFSSGGGLPEDAAAYRSELVRQQDRLSRGWYRSFIAINFVATATSAYGIWLMKPSANRDIVLLITLPAFGVATVMLFASKSMARRQIAKYQRRIDELDAIAGEQ
jgi:hypothetical protein